MVLCVKVYWTKTMNVVLLLDLLYGGVERKEEERNGREKEREKITSAENTVKRDELSYAIVVAFYYLEYSR